jgi:hypothetical protein
VSLRIQLRDTIECWLFPALTACLPWRAGFALLRLLSRLPLYDERIAPALRSAQSLGLVSDPGAFRRRQRLYLLLEHTDLFLSLTRGRRWFARHVRVHGSWPAAGQRYSAVFFHYGTGLWAMRNLAEAAGAAHFLSGPLDFAAERARPLRRAYARLRLREVARVGRAPVIQTGGSAKRLREILERGPGVVVVGGDVPPGATHGTASVRWFGRSAALAQGLAQLAQATGAPLVVFSEQLEGRERTLRIDAPLEVTAIGAAMQALADGLVARVRADPAAWHFWPQLDDYFRAAHAPAGGGASPEAGAASA